MTGSCTATTRKNMLGQGKNSDTARREIHSRAWLLWRESERVRESEKERKRESESERERARVRERYAGEGGRNMMQREEGRGEEEHVKERGERELT